MKLLISATFAVTCLASAGCVFTPAQTQERRSDKVGDQAQSAVRIGVADRQMAMQVLGKPTYSTQNDLAFGYLFAVKTGTTSGLLFGPCSTPNIGTTDVWEDDDVWLEFDERGILKRAEKRLVKRNHNDSDAAWRQFTKSVPDPIRIEQMLNHRP